MKNFKYRLWHLSNRFIFICSKLLGKIVGMKIVRRFIDIEDRSYYISEVGNGIPVIYLMGWLSDVDSFAFEKSLISSLSYLKKYRLITIHLSNFYKSDYSDSPMELSEYSAELKKVLHGMGFDKVHLAGHSAGGRFVMDFAIRYPEMVSSLTLLNSAGMTHAKPSPKALKSVNYSFSKFDVDPTKLPILEQTYINIFDSNIKEQIPSIKSPTLILWGRKDTVINVAHAERLQKLINGAELKIYDSLDHMTVRNPKVFNEMFKFIQRVDDNQS